MNAPGYQTIELLRRGRDLDVYDAWSEERACRCVVKTVRPDRLHHEGPARRLLAEGRLLCRLTHPHIVRAYEVIEEPVPMVVMETLSGETLSHMVEVRGVRLSPAEVAHLGLHLASAVRYLHRHGWLHLDLKPSNVIAECGRAKLIDLSVARPPGPAHPGIGTFYYMAPEQARGGELGAAADVWGLGAVLFEAATGEPAFDHPDDDELGSDEPYAGSDEPYAGSDAPYAESDEPYAGSVEPYATSGDGPPGERFAESDYPQLQGRARRADELRPMPGELADLIAACLEPEPGRRPSLADVLRALEPIAELPAAERRFA